MIYKSKASQIKNKCWAAHHWRREDYAAKPMSTPLDPRPSSQCHTHDPRRLLTHAEHTPTPENSHHCELKRDVRERSLNSVMREKEETPKREKEQRFGIKNNIGDFITVYAIQAVHIASILVATMVQLACFQEALSEQSFQLLRPLIVLFITNSCFLVFHCQLENTEYPVRRNRAKSDREKVCVWVKQRERERDRESVCVCVC